MVCIYCGSKTQTSNSRTTQKGYQVWRRRRCKGCRSIFTTRELVDLYEALRVTSPRGILEPFKRDKLFISLYVSLSHRKTALYDADKLSETVIATLMPLIQNGTVATRTIYTCTEDILERFDSAGAVYYRAHHELEDRR